MEHVAFEAGLIELPTSTHHKGDRAHGTIRIPASHVCGVSKAPGLGEARCRVELTDGSVIVVAA